MVLQALHRPALRDGPAPRLAGRDEADLLDIPTTLKGSAATWLRAATGFSDVRLAAPFRSSLRPISAGPPSRHADCVS